MINLTSKGQMTLPKAAREVIGVQPNGKVIVEIQKDRVTVKKAPSLDEIWALTKTTKKWPGDQALDQLLADELKADYAKANRRRS